MAGEPRQCWFLAAFSREKYYKSISRLSIRRVLPSRDTPSTTKRFSAEVGSRDRIVSGSRCNRISRNRSPGEMKCHREGDNATRGNIPQCTSLLTGYTRWQLKVRSKSPENLANTRPLLRDWLLAAFPIVFSCPVAICASSIKYATPIRERSEKFRDLSATGQDATASNQRCHLPKVTHHR